MNRINFSPKSYIFTFFFALLIVPFLSHRVWGDPLVTDAEMAKYLQFYASITHLDVDFKQTKTLVDMGINLKSQGHLVLDRPDKVVWQVTQPSALTVRLDKTSVQIQTGSGPDAQVQTLSIGDGQTSADTASNSLAGLAAWLTLDNKALSAQYRIYKKDRDSFRFVPKDRKTSPFESLEMTLNTSGHLRALTIHEISHDTIQIDFMTPKLSRK